MASRHAFINPFTLAIKPANLEREYWGSSTVAKQLLNIDRFAFIMSTTNLYSAWQGAAMLHNLYPATSWILRALCLVFFVLSVLQQMLAHYLPKFYKVYREHIILTTRLIRGGWMIVMLVHCTPDAIHQHFLARKLEQGISQQMVVLSLLMLPTLIFVGQCLYWPVAFRRAFPVQLSYVAAALVTMSNIRCALASQALADGTVAVCNKVQAVVTALANLLTEVAVALGQGDGAEESRCDPDRNGEQLLYFWIVSFGLLLPLYVLYVWEFKAKRWFLKRKQQQQQSGTQRRHGRVDRNCLRLGPLLHSAAFVNILILGMVASESMLNLTQPTQCP